MTKTGEDVARGRKYRKRYFIENKSVEILVGLLARCHWRQRSEPIKLAIDYAEELFDALDDKWKSERWRRS